MTDDNLMCRKDGISADDIDVAVFQEEERPSIS